MKKLLFFIQFFLITVIFVNPLDAKVFIEIKVNEKIITNYDIKIEAGYLKILNPNLNQIPRAKLIKLAKQSLIKEAIKEKEILKFSKIDINNTLINNYITGLLSRLNLKNEMEFKNALKDMDSYSLNDIKKKIGIELVWNDLVYNQYNDQIKIDKKEILKKINKIDNIEQNSFKLSEIFFELKKDENFDDKTNLIIQSINERGKCRVVVLGFIGFQFVDPLIGPVRCEFIIIRIITDESQIRGIGAFPEISMPPREPPVQPTSIDVFTTQINPVIISIDE